MGRHRSRAIGAATSTPVGLFVLVAAAYAAGAELSWQLFGAADIGLAFFPAAGITLAAMVLSRPRRWPVIIAAIVAAEMTVDLRHGLHWPHAVGYSVANAVEPLVGAALVRHRARGPIDLARRSGMVRFLVCAVVAGPLVGATIGGATKAVESTQGFGEAAAHWWAGDALGVLTVGVAVLLVVLGGGSTNGALAGKITAQFVMLGASLVAFVVLEVPPVFIVLPVLLWIAIRQSVRSVALASATMALVANVATAEGQGPFAALDLAPQSQLTVAQLTLATTILTAWFLAVEVAERNGLARLHAEDLAIRERARSLTLVGELSESLVRARTVDDVGVAVRSIITERFDAAVVVLDLFDPVSGRFRLAPAGLPDDVVQRVGDWTRTAPFTGPAVARTGKALWIDSNAELLRRFPVLGAVPQAQDVQVLGALPLSGPDGPMGYLIVARQLARPFTHAERDDLKAAAHAASQAVHRALLQEADSARLAQSEQRFRSIADGAPLVIWVHDEHGRQQWVNQTFCDFFGVAREAMDGDGWAVLLHPDDHGAYGRAFAAAVRERARFHARVRVRRADGAWRWLESWGMPQFDPDGRYTGHIGTSADITDQVDAEQLRDRRAATDRFRAALVESLHRDLPVEELSAAAARALAAHLGAEVRVVLPDQEDTDALSTRAIWTRAQRTARAGPLVVCDSVVGDVAGGLGPHRAMVIVALPGPQPQRVGLLAVRDEGPRQWSDEEVQLVEETGERLTLALREALDLAAMRVRHDRSRAVAELLVALDAQPTVEGAMQRLVDSIVPRLADYATVELPGPEPQVLALRHTDPAIEPVLRELRLHHRITDDSVRSAVRAAHGQPHLLSPITAEQLGHYAADDERARLLAALAPRSYLGVPLDLGPLGGAALLVGTSRDDRPLLTEADLGFYEDLARRVGLAVAAGRVRRAEHEAALTLQRALLPDSLIWDAQLPITARYLAASSELEVGGDWYDSFRWPSGHVGLMVGDVVGHSLESAAAMGRLRAATAALAHVTGPDPAALLDGADRFARSPDGTSYATAACAIVDPASGLLTYSSAGHPPMLLVRTDGTIERLADAQSPPLCITEPRPRRNGSRRLRSGDLLVAYSDGLVERRDESLDHGIARLEAAARAARSLPDGELCDDLLRVLLGDARDDDVVLACFRYVPARVPPQIVRQSAGAVEAPRPHPVRVLADEP